VRNLRSTEKAQERNLFPSLRTGFSMAQKQSSGAMNRQQFVYIRFKQNQKMTLKQVTGPFTEEIVSVLPSTVKYICHSGAGYDNIDVEACTKRGAAPFFLSISHLSQNLTSEPGIQVSNTPHCNEEAVADLTIYLMIGALRQITRPNNALRAGTSHSFPLLCLL
jgi:lactate dehydrogenase-like 2-hydroxyacid dehydrogenase